MAGMQKMVVAALTQAVTVAAQLGLRLDWMTPEMISAVGGLLTVVLVYWVPNRP